MNKIFSVLCLLASTSTFAANSVVLLPGGGNVAPATSAQISLNGLISSVTYTVVCYIDTTFPFQYLHMSSQFSDSTSTVSSYSLNGNNATQAQLIAGHNIAIITGNFTNPNTGYLVFTNLDTTNPFNINNCFGIPVQAVTV